MAIDTTIQYASIDKLYLDPKNPRLGRQRTRADLSQDQILEQMEKNWTLDELAASFIESGFWPQEALLVVHETIDGQSRKVVVEGNRRLAALKLLFTAKAGPKVPRKWIALASSDTSRIDPDKIPYIVAASRQDIQAYLGFRHVTGIKEWDPAEKAEFIADLIDNQGMDYEQVRRKIGSKTPTVRQHYIAYRILLQMEDLSDEIALTRVEERFSVLYLSLRTTGVQNFLKIDLHADSQNAKTPVPPENLDNLAKYALWLFGKDKEKQPPLISDSRFVDDFGVILESPKAIEYLETVPRPVFETAYRLAGAAESEVIRLVERAAFDIQQALGTAHHHTESESLKAAVRGLGRDALQLLRVFPDVRAELLGVE